MFTSKCSGNLNNNRQFLLWRYTRRQRCLVLWDKSLQRLIIKLKKDHGLRENLFKRTKISSSNLWKVSYIFINKTAFRRFFLVLYFIDKGFQHSSYHLYNDDTGLEPVFVIPNSKRYDRHSLKQLKSSWFTSFDKYIFWVTVRINY